MNKAKRLEILTRLRENNPHPTTELNFSSPFELLIAVLLSAQATDVSVNKATAKLYPVANTPAAMLELGVEGVKTYIKTIGLYNSKAENIIKTCRILLEQHNEYGWSVAFALSVVGLLITIVNFAFCQRWVKQYGSKPDFEPINYRNLLLTIIGVVALIAIATWLLHNQEVARMALGVVAFGIVVIFGKEAFAMKGAARRKMIVAFILMLEAIIFFVLYSQMPTSLNFFAIRNVEHSILGLAVEPEQYQALNPFWIIIGSPILAAIYNKMGDTLPMPTKFAIGMVMCSGAFLILPLGAKFASDAGIVSVSWLVASYGLQSIGELMISGLGLAMVAQLVPQRLMGFIMGSWFLTTAGANLIGGYVAGMMAVPDNVTDPLMSLEVYGRVFLQIGVATAVIAVLMLLTAPKLHRMTQDDAADKAAKAAVA
ncbi:oligopeptide:H+ symporter [Escherichia coli]